MKRELLELQIREPFFWMGKMGPFWENVGIIIQITRHEICGDRGVGTVGQGPGGGNAIPYFDRPVNPISTGGQIMLTYSPPPHLIFRPSYGPARNLWRGYDYT